MRPRREAGRRLGSDEDAAVTVEYVLMILLVAVACVASAASLGLALASTFQKAAGSLP